MSSGHDEQTAPRSGRRKTLLALGGGAVLGIVVGLAIAFVLSRPDDRMPLVAGDEILEAIGAEDATHEVIGFVPYWDQQRALAEVQDNLDALSTVGPWWYAPTATGEVVVQHEGHTDINPAFVSAIQDQGRKVMPSIANHRSGEWDLDVVGQILGDEDRTAAHVEEITELVVDNGYDGIQIDYENLEARDRDAFSTFVRDLGQALDAHDKTLAVAVHAKTSDAGDGEHNQAQDYAAIARGAHQVHIMTYDHHWDESPPGPVAPLPWVQDVIEYALTQMAADRIVLGIGLFGYDWGGSQTADGLTLEEVEKRKRRYEGAVGWDHSSQAPWFRYSADGVDHELWYENADSVRAKLELVDRYDLAGAFIWRLGGSQSDDVWDTLRRQLRPEA